MAAVTICRDFGAHKNSLSLFPLFPHLFTMSDGTRRHDLQFLNVEFSLSSFTFIKRLFSSSSLSAIRVVSSAYLRLLILLVFPVVMYGCESWTIKKAEHQIIDAFGLWCWRRLLRIPWTARRSNQSIIKEINPEYSLEELMLKLKLHYFGHLM